MTECWKSSSVPLGGGAEELFLFWVIGIVGFGRGEDEKVFHVSGFF